MNGEVKNGSLQLGPHWAGLDISHVTTPCYVCSEPGLLANLEILDSVQQDAGCSIILALKAFSMFSTFALLRRHLKGATASSLFEARLAKEEFGGEVHVCCPAYRDHEFDEILSLADHITFNSFEQWDRFRARLANASTEVRCAIRINPQHSEVGVPIYDPCARYSRLGVTADQFAGRSLEGVSGLHFHTLCELGPDALERTVQAVKSGFGEYLEEVDWVNIGGGQQVTRADYDTGQLCEIVGDLRDECGVEVYLEPGDAVVADAGILVTSVLDIVHNEMDIAVVDVSAAAHMPDVLEMPYRPRILGAAEPGERAHTYRLAGPSCLAGDIIGDYSFDESLEIGSRLVLLDMAQYTMVKNTSFNGLQLPGLVIVRESGDVELVREFTYEDYKTRLS